MHADAPLMALDSANQRVLSGDFDRSLSLGEKAARFPYRGFVEVRLPGARPFLMFSNNDDVVAQHSLYDERPGFEATSLRIWTHLAQKVTAVYDVGAFTGIYALAAAAANPRARVYAFEPSGNTYHRLVTNVWANELNTVIAPLQFALGSAAARAEIRHPFGVYVLGSGESILASVVKEAWFTEQIDVVRADDLEAMLSATPRRLIIPEPGGRCELAKIDVEGYEVSVLQGMAGILKRDEPVLLIECLDLRAVEGVSACLTDWSHRFVDDEGLAIHQSPERFTQAHSRNVLFFSPRRAAEVASVAEAGVSFD